MREKLLHTAFWSLLLGSLIFLILSFSKYQANKELERQRERWEEKLAKPIFVQMEQMMDGPALNRFGDGKNQLPKKNSPYTALIILNPTVCTG